MAARSRLRVAAALVALAVAAASCVQNDGKRFNPVRDFVDVSVEEERNKGAQFDRAAREQMELIHDPVVVGFMSELGQSIVEQTEPQPFLYRFRVVPDSSLNAFAVPGGYVYFNTGTIRSAGSLDELASVMAHEVAHVKAHHWARLQERAALPQILATIAGFGAAAATGEPGLAVAGQGIGQAIAIQYTREFEAEADELATSFMARSGYELDGLAHFFERLVALERSRPKGQMPPYLRTHPVTEARIDAAERRAERTTVTGRIDPDLRARFASVQARLAYLVESGRSRIRAARASPDRAATEPLRREAERLAGAGERAAALETLREAETRAPRDPSLPFRRGELLEEAGRTREAVAAWRRALQLDPEVSLVWLRLGLAYKALGDRHAAAFYLEQAITRAEKGGRLKERAEHALQLLTFPPLRAAGLAAGDEAASTAAAAGEGERGPSVERFAAGGPLPVWWGRVGPRYLDARERIRVRWIGPSGETAQEGEAELAARPRVLAGLEPEAAAAAGPGRWRVEASLDGSVIDRRRFRLLPEEATEAATRP